MQNESQILKNQLIIAFSVILMLMFGVSVAYAENYYTVKFLSSPSGGGTVFPAGDQTVVSGGSTVPVTATPKAGYTFVNWRDEIGNVVSTALTLSAQTITAAKTYTAYFTAAGMNGKIFGTVTDILTKSPIGNVNIKSNQKYSAITDQNGYYNIEDHPAGAYTLVADADGYQSYNISGNLEPSGVIRQDISLCPLTLPKGDLNGNKAVDLQDAISALKILAGLGFSGCYSDVNGDNKIGLEEVIYILQIAAGLR